MQFLPFCLVAKVLAPFYLITHAPRLSRAVINLPAVETRFDR